MAQELLTVDEMTRADRATAQGVDGRPAVPGIRLMENAGAAVADAVRARFAPRPTVVLCGPGNNGGDGFVAARLLAAQGWPVRLALFGERTGLRGDAAEAAARWDGPVESLTEAAVPELLGDRPLVVDALFGAGLGRPLDGAPRRVVEAAAGAGLDVVAVDVPSGVHGDTGEVWGAAAPARLTVTFFRKKPGHLLMPGRALCGDLVLADIGIPTAVLREIGPQAAENGPGLWAGAFPRPRPGDHKYSRGHALILGGERMTGAGRLAARGARRIGAGLVTVLAPDRAIPIYAADQPGLLVAPVDDYADQLADPRRNAVLVGPGLGVGEATRLAALDALAAGKALVLDADGITSFAEAEDGLFRSLAGVPAVLTPHEGEFGRLFDAAGDKASRARAAARQAGAVVLLKGADTVVAAPDGRWAVNAEAPPDLATAGTGDVLSGMVLGLLAQGMPAFEAACAAVWMHGRAATMVGPGLIAEDLPERLPGVLAALRT